MGLFAKILLLARKIPRGKVTTYGAIAKEIGFTDARKVGWAVYGNKKREIPCHRIVFKNGSLAKNYSAGGWQEQKKRLLAEKIAFVNKNRVDLKKHFWKPSGKIFIDEQKSFNRPTGVSSTDRKPARKNRIASFENGNGSDRPQPP